MHNTNSVLIALTTSGQSNLTTGRIAATHGQFNGIRQVVPAVTPTYSLSDAEASSFGSSQYTPQYP